MPATRAFPIAESVMLGTGDIVRELVPCCMLGGLERDVDDDTEDTDAERVSACCFVAGFEEE